MMLASTDNVGRARRSPKVVHSVKLNLPNQGASLDCGLFTLSTLQFFCHANPRDLRYGKCDTFLP